MEKIQTEPIITENNIKLNIPTEILEDIKTGYLIEIAKKNKDTYCYFSNKTICSLLFLSKNFCLYSLKDLISKEDFAEFYYDLDYTLQWKVYFSFHYLKSIFLL